jgi:hypothetical protein
MEAPSIQVVLEALRLLHQQSGDRLVIVGKVMGPWTLSYYMMGMEEFLVATKLEPERARACMNTLKVVTLAIARAQIQAGADIIYLADHASGGIVSPRAYCEFLLPLHQEIFNAIGAPTVLHCCGNTTDRKSGFWFRRPRSYRMRIQPSFLSRATCFSTIMTASSRTAKRFMTSAFITTAAVKACSKLAGRGNLFAEITENLSGVQKVAGEMFRSRPKEIVVHRVSSE